MRLSRSVYVIAEAGVNHNGSLETALKLIEAAKNAGADCVKFQTFKTDLLVSRKAPKAVYQKSNTDAGESQYDMLRKLELSEDDHRTLFDYCKQMEIDFLSTPFDEESLVWLCDHLGLNSIKISSGDLTNAPLLLSVARKGVKVILSTGMSGLAEVECALGVLAFGYLYDHKKPTMEEFAKAFQSESGQSVLKERVVLLHCTTEYPAPLHEVNLNAMQTLSNAFQLPVGYSDHTKGIIIPIAAAAQGACIIEKHFTLDRNLPGPDHQASLEPDELKQMIDGIRQVEEAMGNGIKMPTPSEYKNASVARKSLVATRDIHEGAIFTSDNIGVKRPGTGMAPIRYWELLGKTATKFYHEDEVIDG